MIVDDEDSRIVLKNLLMDFCNGIEIVALAPSIPKAVSAINKFNPDVVFLDIEMPMQNGFQLFEYFEEPQFETIFTTAYDQFALRALRLSAIDYLLKPIDIEELRIAIQKLREKKFYKYEKQKLIALKENLNHQLQKLSIPTSEGILFLNFEDIITCEADGNYTKFFLKQDKNILVAKTLKFFEEVLQDFHFFRANRSVIINLRYVKQYSKNKGATILMEDSSEITLSESKRKSFMELMNAL